MEQDDIKAIAEGRVWSGVRAVEIGLVDSLGSLNDAITAAAQLAEMENYAIASYPEQEDFYTQIINSTLTERISNRIIANRLGYAYEEYMLLNKVVSQTGIMAQMLPIVIE